MIDISFGGYLLNPTSRSAPASCRWARTARNRTR